MCVCVYMMACLTVRNMDNFKAVHLCLYVIPFWPLVWFCKKVYCKSVPYTFLTVTWLLEVKYGIEWKLKKRETCSVNEPFPVDSYHRITRTYHISSSRPGTRSNISCIRFINMYLFQRNSSYSWYSLLFLQLLKISLLFLQIYLFDVCKGRRVMRSNSEESLKISSGHRHISRLCHVAMIRRLLVGLSLRRPRFRSRSAHVEFLVYKVALWQAVSPSEYFGLPQWA